MYKGSRTTHFRKQIMVQPELLWRLLVCSVVYLSIHKVSCADYGVARVTLEAVNVFCSVSKYLKGQLLLPVSE